MFVGDSYMQIENNMMYTLNDDKTKIFIDKQNILIIKDYAILIIQIINYKWAQLLGTI